MDYNRFTGRADADARKERTSRLKEFLSWTGGGGEGGTSTTTMYFRTTFLLYDGIGTLDC